MQQGRSDLLYLRPQYSEMEIELMSGVSVSTSTQGAACHPSQLLRGGSGNSMATCRLRVQVGEKHSFSNKPLSLALFSTCDTIWWVCEAGELGNSEVFQAT